MGQLRQTLHRPSAAAAQEEVPAAAVRTARMRKLVTLATMRRIVNVPRAGLNILYTIVYNLVPFVFFKIKTNKFRYKLRVSCNINNTHIQAATNAPNISLFWSQKAAQETALPRQIY